MIQIRRALLGLPFALGICGFSTADLSAEPKQPRPTPAAIKFGPGTSHDYGMRPKGRSGFLLMDAKTGEVLEEQNPDELFIPASLSKIPTTLMALFTYGPEQQFETKLLIDGTVTGGVLEGDLHLVGGGDPSLQSKDLWKFTQALEREGITSITGRFTFFGGALPQTPAIDKSQPATATYNPGVSGLNLDYNLRYVGDRQLPVARPGLQVAKRMQQMAAARGIRLPMPIRADGEPTGQEIGKLRSAPVSAIIKRMMDKSTNLTAEVLGATAASSIGRSPATLEDAAQMTSEWLQFEAGPIGGKGWTGFKLANHSGLSTRSRVTPRQMAEILRLGYERFGEDFVKLHRNDAPRGGDVFSLRAKIGSMRFVRGYGGFLTVGGRELIFTIISNDADRRAAADAGRTGLNDGRWMHTAREFEKTLLTDWITGYWTRTTGL